MGISEDLYIQFFSVRLGYKEFRIKLYNINMGWKHLKISWGLIDTKSFVHDHGNTFYPRLLISFWNLCEFEIHPIINYFFKNRLRRKNRKLSRMRERSRHPSVKIVVYKCKLMLGR
jgi:hypothetical protein